MQRNNWNDMRLKFKKQNKKLTAQKRGLNLDLNTETCRGQQASFSRAREMTAVFFHMLGLMTSTLTTSDCELYNH